MNEHTQELIVDLLGGRLSQDEERAALANIRNDPALRAEYETQIAALSILDATSTPSMTPEERSTLHAALRQQLRLDASPVPVVATPSRWQRWWAPIGGLAVAAAVVFGAVVVLPGTLSGDDSDGGFAMVSAEITSVPPASPLADDLADAAEVPGADEMAPQATESATDGGMTAGEEALPTTTAAAYDAAIAPTGLPYLVDVDLEALGNQLSSDPESLVNRAAPPSEKLAELDSPGIEACLASLRVGDTASKISPIATTTYEDTEAVVLSISPSDGDPFLAIFSVDSCRELISTKG